MSERIVIVGGGHAAGVAAMSLRDHGHSAELTIVGEEAFGPYQRPPLSKQYLAGQMSVEQLLLKPLKTYAERAIELRLGIRAQRIERSEALVHLSDGTSLGYAKLLLATGSRPRRLNVPGAHLEGVHYLRSLSDVDAIRDDLGAGKRAVVIGGGYIGLEAAAVCVKAGMSVSVLEAGPRILNRVSGQPTAEFFEQEHRRQGVDIRCRVSVVSIEGKDHVRAVVCDDASIPADIVIVGIGIEPVVDLAASAGIECDNGILVDEFARTSDPKIFAAGDCTNHPNALLGRRLRLESVQNAVDQARVAASNICGKPQAYAELPWFWSNQYDLRLQIAGLSQDHEQTLIRGDVASRTFSVLYVRDGRLIATDTINAPREHLAFRKLLAAGGSTDLARLTDPAFPVA